MFCVLTPSMLVYYSSAFGSRARRIILLLRKTANTECRSEVLGWFLRIARYSLASLFLLASLRGLSDDGVLCENEEVLVSLLCKMRVDILNRGL